MSLNNALSPEQEPMIPVPQSFLPLMVLLLATLCVALGSTAALSTMAQGHTPLPFIIVEMCAGAFLASLIFVQQFKEELKTSWRELAQASRGLLGDAARVLIPTPTQGNTAPRAVAYSGVTSS